ITPSQLQKKTPLLYEQLTEDAEEEDLSVSEHLVDLDLDEYAWELVTRCENELEKAKRYEQIVQLTGKATDKLSIPWGKLDIFTKYQAALDNQTYKALKALREAQEWRLNTIDAEPALEVDDSSVAA
ncbi:MAG: hypothetical protein GY753_13940, partial [Gammaproteobacteria bacterium]|nr:hypothetical protein [Gammaproteobacteria bacterium]